MKYIFLSSLLFFVLGVHAQEFLIPSSTSYEKKWVKNKSYEMTWYILKDTLKMEIGKVLTIISKDKDKLTVITEVKMKNMQTPWIDTTIAKLKNLEPVRHSSYNMQRDMVLNFGKIVSGFYNDKIKKTSTNISDTVKGGYFDSNLYPLLIGWLPLKEGYKQNISIYDYNPGSKIGIVKASVKSVTSGIYQTDKNVKRDVWVVTVSDEIANGDNGTSTYYFDKANRRLWKQEIEAKGRKMLMRLIELEIDTIP